MVIPKKLVRTIFSLLYVLWSYLIFYLSSVPDLSSGLPVLFDLIFRKLGHGTIFAIWAYFLLRSFDSGKRPYLVFTFLAGVLYAGLDEWHQSYVPGRNASVLDVLIDSAGVYFGWLVYKNRWLSKFFLQ